MLRRVVALNDGFTPRSPAFRPGGQGMPGLKVSGITRELTVLGRTPDPVPGGEIHGVFFALP